jgi:predicted  nucleic acid-binding Zn-ribbon protein
MIASWGLKAALAEAARYKALAENAERTLAARAQQFNERAHNVVYWKNRAEKAEKQLAKTEATGESSALRAENAELRDRVKELIKASKNPQLKYALADAQAVNKRLNERCVELTSRIAELEKENDVLVQRLGMQGQKDCPKQQPDVSTEDRVDDVLMELAESAATVQPASAPQPVQMDADVD